LGDRDTCELEGVRESDMVKGGTTKGKDGLVVFKARWRDQRDGVVV
jgi:hypothetical protein